MAIPIVLTAAMDAFFGKATSGFVILRSLASGAFEKFNPAGAMIVQRNIDNMVAAMGGLLAPAMETFNKALIKMNQLFTAIRVPFVRFYDTLAKLFPEEAFNKWMAGVADVTQIVIENTAAWLDLLNTLREVGPSIDSLKKYGLVTDFEKVAKGFAFLKTAFTYPVFTGKASWADMMEKFNKDWDEVHKRSTSGGITQAAYKASYMGFEEYQKLAYASAFGSGMTIGEFQNKTLEKQDITNKLLDNIDRKSPNRADWIMSNADPGRVSREMIAND